ncbi:unnamed protein product [Medioppia subpectinata]|uniref:Uncharacterized protein n=1 Tax=Medioppia subpectinata TaxID=1979941 RepID=A0A7R9KTB4_9ACAR|nr:unnamed protein product [Medioppia subpectinata]CAG2108050.1 unnamed protein product [Medioppia subpectinata]
MTRGVISINNDEQNENIELTLSVRPMASSENAKALPVHIIVSLFCPKYSTAIDTQTHGQLACTATDVNLCRNSVPPGPTGVFSYLSCQRPSNRMRTCIYTCNAVPCDVTCANTLDYQRGECIYDVTRTTTSCMCFRQ